jgi:hypothetical protein
VVGVVATAVASALNTPTPRSFGVNLLSGACGYIVGFAIGMARVKLLPRDSVLIDSSALWMAVLRAASMNSFAGCGRRAQQADR